MKLIDLLAVIDDNLTVWVNHEEDCEVYDGKNSIPCEMNSLLVEYVTLDGEGDLTIEVV